MPDAEIYYTRETDDSGVEVLASSIPSVTIVDTAGSTIGIALMQPPGQMPVFIVGTLGAAERDNALMIDIAGMNLLTQVVTRLVEDFAS